VALRVPIGEPVGRDVNTWPLFLGSEIPRNRIPLTIYDYESWRLTEDYRFKLVPSIRTSQAKIEVKIVIILHNFPTGQCDIFDRNINHMTSDYRIILGEFPNASFTIYTVNESGEPQRMTLPPGVLFDSIVPGRLNFSDHVDPEIKEMVQVIVERERTSLWLAIE
jgi:hypothetical protein